jgi:hypothetical protein
MGMSRKSLLFIPAFLLLFGCAKNAETTIEYVRDNSLGRTEYYTDNNSKKTYLIYGHSGKLSAVNSYDDKGTIKSRIEIVDKKPEDTSTVYPKYKFVVRGSEEAKRLDAEFDSIKTEYEKRENN